MELNYDNLLRVLTLANDSERNSYQQDAESQLKSWESHPGYHYLLQDIYLKTELPLQIRWLAIICFKNGIEKYWRSSRSNAISKEEKAQIRTKLFCVLHEKNNQLTIQNAHSTARIVRFDFPGEWPSLFDDITKNLEEFVFQKNDLISTNNLLIILNQIIKTVSMVRIGRARHAMQSKAPIIVPMLIKLYLKFFLEFTSTLNLGLMQICYLCLKNLRRLIPEGFEQPHKNQDIVEFLKITVEHLQALIMEHEKYSSDLLEKYGKCYSKLYVNLINNNPTSFILLPCSQDIMSTFLSLLELKAQDIYNSNEENDFWETLALKGFTILKKMITYIYKKGAITLKQRNDKEEVQNAINKLSQKFFTANVVQHLCDLIINWYLRLKPSDLESWLLEPEEWCNEELSSSWEFQIRPCAENFYQDLIKYFKDDLSGFILNKLSNGLMNNDSTDDILIKDSILCTFQLSASSIADNVDFDKLLQDILIPEGLRNDLMDCKVLKRRICLIISEWALIKCSAESRVSIYKLLITFLQPDNKINDKVVKLTAIQTLRIVIDDWDFNKLDFQPFLQEFVGLSINILTEMNFTESKLYVLNTLAILIARFNPLIDHNTLIRILSVIPDYWNSSESENESILKNSLLRILKNLVISLNDNSFETYSIAIPLIRNCCSENSDLYSLLSEDGYDLWLALLQYCPNSQVNNNEILRLSELLQYGLVNSTEILPIILSITRSYALISPDLFRGNLGLELFRILSGYVSNMRDDSFSIFISLMDVLFLREIQDESFVNILISSGLFNAMLNYSLDPNQSIVSANKMFLVFSRLAYKSGEAFLQILDHLSIDSSRFLDTWLEYYNRNGNPRNKKINLLGLLSLISDAIPKKNETVSLKFADITKRVLLFLEEINETVDGNCMAYNQDFVYEDIDEYCYLDPNIKPHGEKIRYQNLLSENDPVYNINVRNFLVEVINKLRGSLQESDFNQLMTMNDQYSLERLQSLVPN